MNSRYTLALPFKGVSKNSNFFVRARKHRAHDCKDAGARVKQDARTANRSVYEIHEDSSTVLTPLSRTLVPLEGEKCIFRSALKLIVAPVLILLLFNGVAGAKPFYQQQLESATISDKALQKARKQIKEHKDIKLRDKLAVEPFHKREKQKTMAKQAICMNCHLALPHRKNERSRSFMNMHSRYIACETCHLRPKNIQLDYRWLAYDGRQAGSVVAPRSATTVKQENKKDKRKGRKKKSPLAPQAGARIAPFLNNEPVLLFKDSDFARQTRLDWKDANQQQRARLKARLHSPLEKQGPACKACHGKEKPLLDLKALGATTKQLRAMQRNTVVRFFGRYKKDDERIRIGNILK